MYLSETLCVYVCGLVFHHFYVQQVAVIMVEEVAWTACRPNTM